MRFRAAQKNFVLRRGTLGQSKDFHHSAKGLVDATVDIIKRAADHELEVPGNVNISEEKTKRREQEIQQVMNKIEATTVDSAGDELLAGEIQQYGIAHLQDAAQFKNHKVTIRDATHGARRSIIFHSSLIIYHRS